MTWFTFFLLLHVLVAIGAFGPTFAFPFISRFAQKDPRNALVVSEILEGIESKITLPAAVLMPFLGLALIYTGHIDLWRSEWLVISIVLYTITFFFSLLVQAKNAARMIAMLKDAPPPPAGVAAGGPPPHVAAMARKLQLGGMLLTVLVVTIIVLMVWRPGAAFV